MPTYVVMFYKALYVLDVHLKQNTPLALWSPHSAQRAESAQVCFSGRTNLTDPTGGDFIGL